MTAHASKPSLMSSPTQQPDATVARNVGVSPEAAPVGCPQKEKQTLSGSHSSYVADPPDTRRWENRAPTCLPPNQSRVDLAPHPCSSVVPTLCRNNPMVATWLQMGQGSNSGDQKAGS